MSTAATVAAVSFVGGLLIDHQFAEDQSWTRPINPMWTTDGTAGPLSQAMLLIEEEPPDLLAAERLAKRALESSPLSTAALDVLVRVAGARREQELVARYRALIVKQTLRNFPSLRWAFDGAIAQQDYTSGLAFADALLRQDLKRSDAGYILEQMVLLASDLAALPAIEAVLRRESAWRASYLELLASFGPIDVFPTVMQSADIEREPTLLGAWNKYLRRLVDIGERRRAFETWAGLLTTDEMSGVGLVNNGGFESTRTGTLFDWTIARQSGLEFTFDTDNPGDGKRSLRITFGGRPTVFQNLYQTLILDPGHYELSGLVKTNLVASRGLEWVVYCNYPEQGTVIGRSPLFNGAANWMRFSIKLEVPALACDFQTLRLDLPARIPAERQIEGSIWLDGLAVSDNDASVDGSSNINR